MIVCSRSGSSEFRGFLGRTAVVFFFVIGRQVCNSYQRCPEMLSVPRTSLMSNKNAPSTQDINNKSRQKRGCLGGCPVAGAGAPRIALCDCVETTFELLCLDSEQRQHFGTSFGMGHVLIWYTVTVGVGMEWRETVP